MIKISINNKYMHAITIEYIKDKFKYLSNGKSIVDLDVLSKHLKNVRWAYNDICIVVGNITIKVFARRSQVFIKSENTSSGAYISYKAMNVKGNTEFYIEEANMYYESIKLKDIVIQLVQILAMNDFIMKYGNNDKELRKIIMKNKGYSNSFSGNDPDDFIIELNEKVYNATQNPRSDEYEFQVKGHWRHYKSGKSVWVDSYDKRIGSNKKDKNLSIK